MRKMSLNLLKKIRLDDDESFGYDDGFLWNSGMFLYRAGDLINAARAICPELYDTCRMAKRKVAAIRRTVRFRRRS